MFQSIWMRVHNGCMFLTLTSPVGHYWESTGPGFGFVGCVDNFINKYLWMKEAQKGKLTKCVPAENKNWIGVWINIRKCMHISFFWIFLCCLALFHASIEIERFGVNITSTYTIHRFIEPAKSFLNTWNSCFLSLFLYISLMWLSSFVLETSSYFSGFLKMSYPFHYNIIWIFFSGITRPAKWNQTNLFGKKWPKSL